MGTQKNRLNEMVLLSTENICSKLWVRKYLQFYSENFCLSKPMHKCYKLMTFDIRCRQRVIIKGNLLLLSVAASGRLTTYCLTSSSLLRLNSLRILLALFGPRRLGIVLSVRPGISCSPEEQNLYKFTLSYIKFMLDSTHYE